MKPLVAIVGRPNVGKSTFFNKLSGKRLSIVEDTPGVTRDRLYTDVTWLDYTFTLVDTGGIELKSDDVFYNEMLKQAEVAVETADVILFFTDARQGMLSADQDVADYLRKKHNNIILVVNKVDGPTQEDSVYDFYSLGLGEPESISALNMMGFGDLLDRIVENFPHNADDEEDDDTIKIAVVGKPNAGKSSLVNKLLGEQRSIVSNIPGTTRDAIDTPFEQDGQKFVLIDTAGIRRKKSIDDGTVERYSVIRSLDAIRRSDVALIVLDASQGMTEQDVKIAGYVKEQGKAALVVVNKWDLIEKDTNTSEKFKKKMRADLAFMDYVDYIFISAMTGQRTHKILSMVKEIYDSACKRISTGILNDTLSDAMQLNEPPTKNGKRLKIKYAAQVAVKPPTFILFVNDQKLMHFSYKRYLENSFREAFGFRGTPINLILREKEKE
ncbi:MAG: ribosome biogenesis GTPase Der [Clostridiales bacterium]|nr:ribosome biogenesis GTPase Der [Clostridiales bacterium]